MKPTAGKNRLRSPQWVGAGVRLLLVLFALHLAQAQNRSALLQSEIEPMQQRHPRNDAGELAPNEYERQLRLLNAERQKTMVSDAGKLLKLATQLNAEIAASDQAELTPEQLKRVAEIEKLARKVKQKMSFSVRGTPSFPTSILFESQ
jgi:hypothetical protein